MHADTRVQANTKEPTRAPGVTAGFAHRIVLNQEGLDQLALKKGPPP